MPAPNGKPSKFFELVLSRTHAGEKLKEVCAQLGMSSTTFRQYANECPNRKYSYDLAVQVSRARGRLSSSFEHRERHFTEILALVAGGTPMPVACKSKPEYPAYDNLRHWAASIPEQNARMKAAMKKYKATVNYTDEECEAALQAIALNADPGTTLEAICAAAGVVPFAALQNRKHRKPAFREKYRAAIAAHYAASSRAWYGVGRRKHDPIVFHEAVTTLKQRPRVSVQRHLAEIGLPLRAFNSFARRAPGLRDQISAHVVVRKELNQPRPKATPLTPDQLRRPLLENQYYRNASALLRMADTQDRDDLVSDAIVAMLESRDVSKRELLRGHHRRVSSRQMISTDEDFGIAGYSVLDTMRTDEIAWGT